MQRAQRVDLLTTIRGSAWLRDGGSYHASARRDARGRQRGKAGSVATTDDYGKNERDFNEFSGIAIIAVYLALASVMAACALLNLDLIVLMVCGSLLKNAKGSIWHDTVALTALGILCGLVLGNARSRGAHHCPQAHRPV